MEPFAGYMMPIVYKNQTIKQEHLQTRNCASVFDVSHMMQVLVLGKDRLKFIEQLTVADLENLPLNKCTLSLFPNEKGGIIDDCVISKGLDHLHIVSNAGNAETVWSWLNSNLAKSTKKDVSLVRQVGRGLIALQGPNAMSILKRLVNVDLENLEFMTSVTAQIKDVANCQITRCGYTGEDGFEISVKSDEALNLMETLCSLNEAKPAGLGARDTLRLEAGLCLHGHDITTDTTPIEAGLNWVIQKRRRTEGQFFGFNIISKQLKEGSAKKRVGLVGTTKGPPAREGAEIFYQDKKIGIVTSGTISPCLQTNIAMGYVPTNMSKHYGQSVHCQIRGKSYEYNITKMPFIQTKYFTKKKNISQL